MGSGYWQLLTGMAGLALVLHGCGSDRSSGPGDQPDAAMRADARDSGGLAQDSGGHTDALPAPDSGAGDAPIEPDATVDGGPPEAGPADARPQPDAAASDADASENDSGGVPDADGAPFDTDADSAPDPCSGCNAVCLPDGGCVECIQDEDCTDGERCHPALRTCVACLVGAEDSCPTGEYCNPETFACVSGCKDNTACTTGICTSEHVCVECEAAPVDTCPGGQFCSAEFTCVPGCKPNGDGCASGRCGVERDCEQCLADTECADGRLCGSGECHATCTTADECPTGWSCCGGRCADTSRDFLHCGDCGTSCTGEQYCNGITCVEATLAELCSVSQVTFILDGLAGDDAVAADALAALAAGCPSGQTQAAESQAASARLNGGTGQPVVGSGSLTVVLGGSFGQKLVQYLENEGISRIYSTWDPAYIRFHGRATDGGVDPILVDAPQSSITDSHSYFLVESIVDPESHSWIVEIYGLGIEGTIAGAWFLEHQMLTDLSAFSARYYIYEWTDQDASLSPTAADAYDLVTSG